MNVIFYVLRGGVARRLLPNDLPPRTTVYRWFAQWRDTGLLIGKADADLGTPLGSV